MFFMHVYIYRTFSSYYISILQDIFDHMIINEDNSMTSNTEYNIKVHSENSMENYNTVQRKIKL